MSSHDQLHTGELYLPMDPSILEEQLACLDRLYTFNQTRPTELERRQALLREMFAEVGENCYIEPPLHTNFGGRHVHFGRQVYANFNLTLVDDTHIYVGDCTMFGPNVVVPRRDTPSCRSCGSRGTSSTCPCTSAATAGWGRGSSSCPA